MCAITGVLNLRPKNDPVPGEIVRRLVLLFAMGEERGRDGFGVLSAYSSSDFETKKLAGRAPKELDYYHEYLKHSLIRKRPSAYCILSNHRAEPTTEFVRNKTENDQQPYQYKSTFIVHNGTVANDKGILKGLPDLPTEVDSYAIAVKAEQEGAANLLETIKGSQATLVWDQKLQELTALRNYNPLSILFLPDEKIFLFSSFPKVAEIFPEGKLLNFPPYSTVWGFKDDGAFQIKTTTPPNRERALVVCSGGLDSVTVAKIAVLASKYVRLLHFLYGCQAEEREMEAIQKVSEVLGCEYEFIDMGWLKKLGGSPLTEDGVISDGISGAEFAHEWVPARNTAMIGIAAAYADRYDCGRIYFGENIEEASAYPDNTIEFHTEFNKVLDVGTLARPQIVCPVATKTKREIVELAYEIGAPIEHSWSCYKGGAKRCGVCGPDYMRMNAHRIIGKIDPVEYEQVPEGFWNGCHA